MAVDHSISLGMLSAGFHFDLPGETQVVYNRVLGEYNQEAVRGAVVYILRNSKRFPSIAELLDVIEAGHGKRETGGESDDAKLAARMFSELGFGEVKALTDEQVFDRYSEPLRRLYPTSQISAMGALGILRTMVNQERDRLAVAR